MANFTEVAALMPTLRGHLSDEFGADSAHAAMSSLTDAEIVKALEEAVEVSKQVEQIKLAVIGIAAARSARESGHSGLAQSRGHRSAVALVQRVTGGSRADAAREVRVGSALLEAAPGVNGAGQHAGDEGDESDAAAAVTPSPPQVWHEPLRAALKHGRVTSAQFDAIRRGLGEPPAIDDAVAAHEVLEAWSCAAEHLVEEANYRTLEELRVASRALRDQLDPQGAEARFLAQYEARHFRIYRDSEGRKRGSIVFDEESGAFVEAFVDAALRPRRGGPRFIDPDEKATAADLADDPRTNDQLAFDLIIDVLRAGVLADPEGVFATRQAGVRLVQMVGADGVPAPIVHTEDGLVALPASVAEQRVCESGQVSVTIDPHGKPLDVGREHRLFTPRQRVALAIRDGGCRWRGCDRPASYCEAHHIDPYSQGGRTAVDRGILLCRYHHMALHHGRWRITRDGQGDFVLRHPDGESTALRPRLVLRYAWNGVVPPPKRFRPVA